MVETRLVYCVHLSDFGQLRMRASDLIGEKLEDEPEYMITRIIQFQVVKQEAFWYLWLLVEVDRYEEIGE